MNEKELRVYGNGEHIRDWLYVEDNIRNGFGLNFWKDRSNL
jgi:dTDP-D-glucose 4,6-dehydratase